ELMREMGRLGPRSAQRGHPASVLAHDVGGGRRRWRRGRPRGSGDGPGRSGGRRWRRREGRARRWRGRWARHGDAWRDRRRRLLLELGQRLDLPVLEGLGRGRELGLGGLQLLRGEGGLLLLVVEGDRPWVRGLLTDELV